MNYKQYKKEIPQIVAFEDLKRATNEDQVLEAIREGRLPYEAVTGNIKPSVEVWEELMHQMPIFALTRHLVTLDEAGVLKKQRNVDYIVSKLTNRDNVLKSKMMPFRWFTAYKMFNGKQDIKEALNTALDLSFDNVPTFPGNTAVAVDTSGSMNSPVSQKSIMRMVDVGAILGAALFKKSEHNVPLAFGTYCIPPRLLRSDPILTVTEKFAAMGAQTGYGTDVVRVFEHLVNNSVYVDQLVIVTDMQSWAEWHRGTTLYAAWHQYRTMQNPNLKVFWLNVNAYDSRPTDPGTDKVNGFYYIHGWSDRVLPFIQMQLEGTTGLKEAIEKVSLEPRYTDGKSALREGEE